MIDLLILQKAPLACLSYTFGSLARQFLTLSDRNYHMRLGAVKPTYPIICQIVP